MVDAGAIIVWWFFAIFDGLKVFNVINPPYHSNSSRK
jgi:hypothetical protein